MTLTAPPGAHALLVAKDGSIILQQKTLDYSFNPLNSGKVSMFGGGAEPGEEPLDTLKRELKEELKLEVSTEAIQEFNVYKKNQEQDGASFDVYVFVVRNIDPETLSVDKSDSVEGTAGITIDTVEGFLNNPNLSRITKLALLDYKEAT